MAMQPIDRKNAKHAIVTARRSQPALIQRSHKLIKRELGVHAMVRGHAYEDYCAHERMMARIMSGKTFW